MKGKWKQFSYALRLLVNLILVQAAGENNNLISEQEKVLRKRLTSAF